MKFVKYFAIALLVIALACISFYAGYGVRDEAMGPATVLGILGSLMLASLFLGGQKLFDISYDSIYNLIPIFIGLLNPSAAHFMALGDAPSLYLGFCMVAFTSMLVLAFVVQLWRAMPADDPPPAQLAY